MIAELITAVFAYGLGWAYLRLFVPQRDVLVLCAAAFPMGVALWVLVAMMVIVLQIPYSAAVPTGLAVVGLAAAHYRFGRPVARHEGSVVAAAAGALAAIAAVLIHFELTIQSSDGGFILATGRQIAQHGGLTGSMKGVLASFSTFLSFAETAAVPLGLYYFKSLMPLSALSAVFLVATLGHRVLTADAGSRSLAVTILPAGAALALLSSYPFAWSGFYIKTAPIYAFMLLAATATAYLAASENNPRWLGITALALLSTMGMRVESGLTTLPALIAVASLTGIALRLRAQVVAPVALAIGGWYAFLIIKSFAYGMFSVYQLFVIGLLPGLFGLALIVVLIPGIMDRFPWLERAIEGLPWLMVGTLVLFIIGYGILKPGPAVNAVSAFACYVATPERGATAFWIGIGGLALVSPFLAGRFRGETVFVTVILGFLLVVLAISIQYGKSCGFRDSTNRMLVHIMPTLIFYVMIKFGRSGHVEREPHD